MTYGHDIERFWYDRNNNKNKEEELKKDESDEDKLLNAEKFKYNEDNVRYFYCVTWNKFVKFWFTFVYFCILLPLSN